jgi:hypothetical protein
VAMVIDAAALGIERDTVERFVHRQPQREPALELEFVLCVVDQRVLETDSQMQPPRPRFAPHPLPYDCRSGRFDSEHSHIIEVAPACKVRQQLPDCLDRSFDDCGGTNEIGWRQCRSGIGGRDRSGDSSRLGEILTNQTAGIPGGATSN